MREMHFFWADSPMPWLRYACFSTFFHHNPDWKVVVWTSPVKVTAPTWVTGEGAEYLNGYDGHDWRQELADFGNLEWRKYLAPPGLTPTHESELCRWDALAEGAIFADTDIVWTAPITDEHYALLSKPSLSFDKVYRCGLMGGGEPFKRICDFAYTRIGMPGYQDIGPNSLWALAPNLPELSEKVGHISNIPMHWVHPFPSDGAWLEILFASAYTLQPDTLGVHWYGGGGPGQREALAASPESTGGFYDIIRGYV